MTTSARFDSFHLSIDGKDVVYGGRLPDRTKVEIRQPAADSDVMIVLLASVFERTRDLKGSSEQAHRADAVRVTAGDGGDVILSVVSHSISRSFRVDRQLAVQLSAEVAAAANRTRLRAVP